MNQFFRIFLATSIGLSTIPTSSAVVHNRSIQSISNCADTIADTKPQIKNLRKENKNSPDQVVVEELVNAEIIHSNFFKKILDIANKHHWKGRLNFEFDSLEKIHHLTSEDNDKLASLLYEVMRSEINRNSDLFVKFTHPEFSRKIFNKHSREYIVDKIGEALIISGKYKSFNSIALISNEQRTLNSGSYFNTGGVFALLSFATFFHTEAGFFLLPTIGGLIFSVKQAVDKYERFQGSKDFARNKIFNEHQKILKNYKIPSGPIVELEPEVYKTVLATIKEEASKIKSEEMSGKRATTKLDLTTFGNDAVELQVQLTRAYYSELKKWWELLSEASTGTKKHLQQITDEKITLPEDQNKPLNYLKKVAIETLEATNKTRELSQQIVDVIDKDLQIIKDSKALQRVPIVQKLGSQLVDVDSDIKSQHLSASKVVFEGFILSLHKSSLVLSNVLESLETVDMTQISLATSKVTEELLRQLAKEYEKIASDGAHWDVTQYN